MSAEIKEMYRYEAWRDEGWEGHLKGIRVELKTYPVTGRTPRGAHIYCMNNAGKNRWVSLHTRKAFAYATKEDAMNSFKIRNKRRIMYLERDLKEAKMARAALEREDLYEPEVVTPAIPWSKTK